MIQKYKFFISDSFVLLSDSEVNLDEEYQVKSFSNDEEILQFVFAHFDSLNLENNIVLTVKDLSFCVTKIWAKYRLIEAAGGYVLRNKNFVLMIHRLGSWDMPKGKVEKGETIESAAIREVEEECGVSDLRIESDPFVTFHLYHHKGKTVIKKSYWFRMISNFKGKLKPQTEEHSELAEWVGLPIKDEILSGSYSSIREVAHHFSV
jgi:8-oxo-dGTP pyrophosphatase MutT (NUDIX family)